MKVLWGLIFLYFIVFGTLVSFRHYNFQTQTWDMAAFVQTMWNSTQGRWMQNNIEEVKNHLGVHLSPFLFLLVPGYALFQSPYFLLILQTLVLSLGAWPLYLLARRILNDKSFPLLVSGAYLLYPSLHWINWFDFHPIAFLVPFLLAAFYFIETKRWRWASLFLILAASTQEDAVLAVMFLGIYLMLAKKEYKKGGLITALSFAYFLISIKVLMPALGGGLLRLDRYQQLGGSFSEIAKNAVLNPEIIVDTIFTSEKFFYFLWLFLPVAFLPFYSGWAFLLLAPGLLENLLTNFEFQFTSLYQYDSVLVSGVFISSLYGLKKLLTKWPSGRETFFRILLVGAILGFILRSPLNPQSFPTELFRENQHWEAFREMLKFVPDQASVAAHTNLVPHLSHRLHAYMLGYEPFMTDVVLADAADYFGFSSPEAFQFHVEKYLASGNYELKVLHNRYFILTRKQY